MLRRLSSALVALIRGGNGAKENDGKQFNSFEPDSRLLEGLAYQKAGDVIAAERLYSEVLRYSPNHPDAHHLLATLEQRRGNLDRAEALVRRALEISPNLAEYSNTLATLLTDIGCHSEAIEILRTVLQISPNALRPRTNLLFLLHLLPGVTRAAILAEHVEWANRHAKPNSFTTIESCAYSNSQKVRTSGRLRVGYISADFCGHPVGRIMSAILPNHDPNEFEIYCYDNASKPDELNAILRNNAYKWIDIGDLDDNMLVERICADEINILIDLSGHTKGSRLVALGRKPAPIQVGWLGYLGTTGMKAMDWRLTDRRSDPEPDAQSLHVEGLWYLPNCLWPWGPSASFNGIEVGPPPSIKSKFITFGSFNTFRKINYQVIATWAEVLREIPSSRLRIYGAPSGRAVELVYDQFESEGIDIDRIDLFASVDYSRYLNAYREIDIALDPFPYCGGATTCESLWMGVPVITLAGEGGFSRTGAGLLGAIGLDECVAATTADYVRIAVQLARDPARLSELRRTLRERVARSPMADAEGFVRDLENAYSGMWRHFVLSHPNRASFSGNTGLEN